ncbi:MAG: hypothetical protein DCC67_08180, partial [Planctomycetota bacterium]
MTDHTNTGSDDDGGRDESFLAAARRAKLARIVELGHDPWGARFDDRQMIAEILAAASGILFRR